jgi:hypothetical protein
VGPSGPPTEAVPAAAVPVTGPPRFQGLVVGRRRLRRLDVLLAQGNIADITTRAYVLGMFANVTPTGPARMFDELLGGALSELVSRRMLSAHVGEVFMLPTGNHPLRADVLLFAGLGPFDRFTNDVGKTVAENVVRTLVLAGIDEFATLLFGSNSVREPATMLENLLAGFLAGLADADKAQRFRRIILCEYDPQRYQELREGLYRLSATPLFDALEVTLDELILPAAPAVVAAPAARLPGPGRDRIYLSVRQRAIPGDRTAYESTLLTSGGKAAVLAGAQPVVIRELEDLLKKVGASGFNLDTFGPALAKLVLTKDLIDVLARPEMKRRHLVLVHDALASQVPWETLKVGDYFPALEAGVSRQYAADNLAIARWLEERRFGPTLDLLLVVNPTRDLEGAEREGKIVRDLVKALPSVRIQELNGAAATWSRLRSEIRSGEYDVLHYAGHAEFDPANRARCGIRCADNRILSGEDLASLGNLPALVFFNACESARVRNVPPPTVRERLRDSVAFAEAFLVAGVANFVGTYWPVGDAAAETFAKTFYGDLIAGKSIGDSLLTGRKAVRAAGSVDWADYIHYGDPDFTPKQRSG